MVDTVVGLVVNTVDLVGGVTIGNDGLLTGVVQSKTKDTIIKKSIDTITTCREITLCVLSGSIEIRSMRAVNQAPRL